MAKTQINIGKLHVFYKEYQKKRVIFANQGKDYQEEFIKDQDSDKTEVNALQRCFNNINKIKKPKEFIDVINFYWGNDNTVKLEFGKETDVGINAYITDSENDEYILTFTKDVGKTVNGKVNKFLVTYNKEKQEKIKEERKKERFNNSLVGKTLNTVKGFVDNIGKKVD